MRAPFIIYADLESLLEKLNTCHDNPEKSRQSLVQSTSSSTKINIRHLFIHYLRIVHLIKQKINLIIIEVKIV